MCDDYFFFFSIFIRRFTRTGAAPAHMSETAFRGTLLLLQNRTRRDPESYKDEFLSQLEHFKASSASVLSQRVASEQYIAVLNFLCHVCHCFPKEAEAVASIVVELLRSSLGNGLPTSLRANLVKALMLLRSKGVVSTEVTFPILFSLLQEREKEMRERILSHIVTDIRKINMPGVKGGANVNRVAQNFLFSVMAEDDPIQAKCAEMVMIDLYRRRVWCDERTVEVMTKACFSKHTATMRMAFRFFLLQMPKLSSMNDNSDDEEQDPGRSISKLKQKLKIVKKTSKRDRVLKRNVRDIKRKYNKEEREAEAQMKQHVDPIRLLRDPQQFVERLLAKLQKTSERFEVRILILNVIARAVQEHEVVHLPLYSFLVRYMEPSQLHSTQLLALSSMCIHRMVPPDAVEPIVKAIANHFVTDRSTPDAITVGLNTIREMCKRQPLAMEADLLKDLVEYKNQRGEKGVIMAARALLQLYREVYPELLPPKLRGSAAGPADLAAKPLYGQESVFSDIPGLDLLYQNLDDESDEESSDSSSTSDSEEWVTDSDEDPEDVEGSFVSVSDDEGDSDIDVNDDECPQLVPVRSPSRKRPREANSSELACKEVRKDQELQKENDDSDDDESDEEEDEDDDDENDESDEDEYDDDDDDDSDEDDEDENEESDEDEDEDSNENEEETEEGTTVPQPPKPVSGWYEALSNDSSPSSPPSVTGSTVSREGITSRRMLTDADFEKIRRLQAQNGGHQSLRGKKKEKEARSKRRNDLLYSISNDISAQDLEHFTERKRDSDKQERLERAQELRKASSKFEIGKKKKSKLNSTHTEHSKRGKLFQMTKRSQRVATKLKSSVGDRATRAAAMKKKDVKFRIKRGWKA